MTTTDLTPNQVTEIPITKLLADPDQPRKSFADESLQRLADSMKHRVHVPLLVRPGLKGKYIIHDGERRLRAAKLAKLKTLPCLLVDGTDDQHIRTDQFAVNNLREQLKPMEVARLLADLQRKHFKSANELAAHLEASGLPAMTPKQINEAIALVDLPEWAQDMLDAGQVEISAAVQLKIAMPYPEVLKDVKGASAQDLTWKGRVTARDVIVNLQQSFRHHGHDLGKTGSWHGDQAVHFNPKVVCKGCEHLVNVSGEKYCMNIPEFERHNAEAKAAGLLPGGKKPEKAAAAGKAAPAEVEVKAEKREQSLGEKARAYLHAYLVNKISAGHLVGNLDLSTELLAWHAMERPGVNAYYVRRCAGVEKYEGAEHAKITCLEDLFRMTNCDEVNMLGTVQIIHDLPWRETQVICHEQWGPSIESVWTMDDGFVGLFRKAELVHLATTHKLTPPEGKKWENLKASELKAQILARADQVRRPAILRDIYADVAKPYESLTDRYGYGGEDETDDAGEGGGKRHYC